MLTCVDERWSVGHGTKGVRLLGRIGAFVYYNSTYDIIKLNALNVYEKMHSPEAGYLTRILSTPHLHVSMSLAHLRFDVCEGCRSTQTFRCRAQASSILSAGTGGPL